MPYDPQKHHRRSIRLQNYDYSLAGAYFITIVTQSHASHFATIDQDRLSLNAAGEMIQRWWEELPQKFPSVETEAFIVMPNHTHGILLLTNPPEKESSSPNQDSVEQTNRSAPTLGEIMKWFKTMTTNEYMPRGVKQLGWQPFENQLWQRNYYEHILRNPTETDQVAHYIFLNPANWLNDPERISGSL